MDLRKAEFDINTKNKKGENLIDGVSLFNKFYINYDVKENLIKELIKRNCQVSKIKNKHRFP